MEGKIYIEKERLYEIIKKIKEQARQDKIKAIIRTCSITLSVVVIIVNMILIFKY